MSLPNYLVSNLIISSARINYKIKDSSSEFSKKQLKDVKDKFLIGINITAGSDARFWGTDNFKQLIEIISDFKINFVIFTTESKYSEALQIADGRYIYPVSKDFDIFAAGISKVDLLFTPDTSVVHVASMFEIPVFGIYVKYNTNEMIWSPYHTDFDCVITEKPTFKNVHLKK